MKRCEDEKKKLNNKRRNKTWHQNQLKTSFLIPFSHLVCFVVFFTLPALRCECVCVVHIPIALLHFEFDDGFELMRIWFSVCASLFTEWHLLGQTKRMNRNWTKASSRPSTSRTKNCISKEFFSSRGRKKNRMHKQTRTTLPRRMHHFCINSLFLYGFIWDGAERTQVNNSVTKMSNSFCLRSASHELRRTFSKQINFANKQHHDYYHSDLRRF